MPKYYPFKIEDHYLYFTAECIVEAMHVIIAIFVASFDAVVQRYLGNPVLVLR